MKKQGNKKQKFDDLFKKKLAEFKDGINKSLKERFDKDLKRALYHLWKHYENCQKFGSDRDKIESQLNENLEKVRKETKDYKNQVINSQKTLNEEERTTSTLLYNNILDDAVAHNNRNYRDQKDREIELRLFEFKFAYKDF